MSKAAERRQAKIERARELDIRGKDPSKVDKFDIPGLPEPPPGMKRFVIDDDKVELNTVAEKLEDNIYKSIRRQFGQICNDTEKAEEIIITGGGPSLKKELPALRQLVFEGKKIFATNGSANWLVSQNIRPSAVVVVDARPFNARFVAEEIPNCKYYIGSQCDESIFDAVEDYKFPYIFHCVNTQRECDILDDYYGSNWFQVVGGSTVVLRTIMLAYIGGFRKMHIFGLDSCYMDGEGHSYPQAENDVEEQTIWVEAAGKMFQCSGWHYNQLEHFVKLVRDQGDKFQLAIHGDGLIRQVMENNLVYRVHTEDDVPMEDTVQVLEASP